MASPARTERALHPSDRAAVIYAFCSPELVGRRMTIEGRRVQALAAGRFGLLASYVDRESFTPEALVERVDDRAWQAHHARVHERAVERLGELGGVVPTRPLTIVADATTLAAYARERAVAWARAYNKFRDARECAVHLYAGPHRLPFDEPYLVRVSARVERSSRVAASLGSDASELEVRARAFVDACVTSASASRRMPTTGRGHLASLTLLLPAGAEQRLAALAHEARAELQALGVAAYLEAPRAPHSFV